SQVGMSDVWYLSARLPRGARFAYSISPNDALENPAFGQFRSKGARPDPLNPNHWSDTQSMVELPGAVPQPWILKKAGVPEGKIDKQRIKSDLLDNERDIWVYVPPNYKPVGAPY